jgi:hypothetical protein
MRLVSPILTDRERILLSVIRGLYGTQLYLTLRATRSGESTETLFASDFSRRTHFATYRTPQKGDLVLCQSMPLNEWVVGFCEENRGNGEMMVREIGSDRLCHVGNESFVPITGLNDYELLEGDQFKFQQKVIKTFWKYEEYSYMYAGVDFLNETDAIIWVRKKWSDDRFSIPVNWTTKISMKKLADHMRQHGYGTYWEAKSEETSVA